MMSTHLLVTTLLWSVIGWAEAPANDPSDALFSGAAVPRIHIRVEPEPLDKLKGDPRNYVKAAIQEDARVAVVALKLKGAAGSFRDWDDRPALTLNMRKFSKGGNFHGLVKFHLNNSVQDETYLHEQLCSELFRRAGIPAPRVTHARVWLNGRDVGLYVLKEGFDRSYLKRSFPDPTGNLYDGGFCQDINADLEKDEGDGPDDRSDLRAVVDAAADPDSSSRVRRVESLVDMDAFLTFMAMERMTCHWDGYTNTANNYRIYFDPRRGKAIFLPHGMDQMFADPEMGLFDPTDKIVASVVMRSEALRRRYRQRLEQLIPLMSPADALVRRVDELDRRLKPVIASIDRERATGREGQVAELKQHLVARAASLRRQIGEPEETLQRFDDRGVASLNNWFTASECERAVNEEVETDAGKKALSVRAGEGEACVASWRHRVLLGPGQYTLQADVRTDRVVKRDDTDRSGVGIGISGVERDQHLHGTTPGKTLSYRFRVGDERKELVLVLELRARSGQVWFLRDSIKLIRENVTDVP
jgi:spore coat protein H